MAKQRASKKSVKKAPAAKKKCAVKKKSGNVSAKKSKPVSGKKSNNLIERFGIEKVKLHWGMSPESEGPAPGHLRHILRQIVKFNELVADGFPAEDIQIVLRYKTLGGVVENRGIRELE